MSQRETASFQLLVVILWLAAGSAALPAAAGEAGEDAPSCPADARWGLVVDAGSSGSRLRFYCWRPGVGDALPWIEDAGTREREPGIADAGCTRTPAEAVAGLRPLIDGAIEIVGGSRSVQTPLSLMATAGLRRCPKDYQDAMLDGIREYFARSPRRGASETPPRRGANERSPFADPQAKLISGADEGRYGWTGVNYLLKRLDPGQPLDTVGALDLGGVSTQITFMPGACTGGADDCGAFDVGDRSYPLYTRSFLGWGQDQAMRRVASRACYLRGYRSPDGSIDGRGKYRACRRAIRKGMAKAVRSDPPEPACTSSCNRLGAYQPPLSGDFVGFSAFAYNTGFLGLGPELTLAQLRAAGKEYCRTPWQEAVASCRQDPRPGCKEEWLNRYCFASAYIVHLLHEVYGLPMDRQITSTNELAGADIDWTLGVMVQMAEELSASGEP